MISLLLPTRKRPDNIQRLWLSVLDTADNVSDIEMILAVDDDDDSYDNLELLNNPNIDLQKYPRMVLSEYWNRCYERSEGDILMHCGDDIIFRTKGWDTIVKNAIDAYEDKIVFVYGNDGSGVHDGRFGTHGFVHRNWAESVGYFEPSYFSSDYNDTWLNDVAKMIGRHQHIDILTEHMHPDLKKAEYDEVHLERLERHKMDNVSALYESTLSSFSILSSSHIPFSSLSMKCFATTSLIFSLYLLLTPGGFPFGLFVIPFFNPIIVCFKLFILNTCHSYILS